MESILKRFSCLDGQTNWNLDNEELPLKTFCRWRRFLKNLGNWYINFETLRDQWSTYVWGVRSMEDVCPCVVLKAWKPFFASIKLKFVWESVSLNSPWNPQTVVAQLSLKEIFETKACNGSRLLPACLTDAVKSTQRLRGGKQRRPRWRGDKIVHRVTRRYAAEFYSNALATRRKFKQTRSVRGEKFWPTASLRQAVSCWKTWKILRNLRWHTLLFFYKKLVYKKLSPSTAKSAKK